MPIIINSKFRPFSFQEMLQPVAMAALAHLALEDLYAELDTKASMWEKLKDSEIDRDVYQQYKAYSDALKSSSDELALFGLTPSSRRAMLDMRARYSKDIAPIELAYLKRELEALLQMDAYVKSGGKNIYSRDARTTKLSDYINDRVLDYSMVNLDNVMNEGIAAGKAISSRYFRTEEGKRFGGDYYNLTTKLGLTPLEAFTVLNDPKKYPEFSRFILDTLSKYQIQSGKSIFSDEDSLRANNALMQGINLGIMYDEKNNPMKNWRAELAALEAKEKRVAVFKAGLSDTPTSTKFGNRIIEGVLGSIDENVQRVKGLKPTGANSYSTDALDAKQRILASRQEALDKYLNSLPKGERDKILNYRKPSISSTTPGVGSYANLGRMMTLQTHEPKGYALYSKLKRLLDAAYSDVNDEQSYLRDLENKYAHFGNGYTALYIGTRLADLQEKQEKSSFALNVDSNEYDNLRDRLGNLYGSFSKDSYDAKTVGIFDKNGKKMKYEDVKAMFALKDLDKKPTIKVSGGLDNKLKLVYNGEEYTMSGVAEIDKFQQELSKVNTFLSDFSIDAVRTKQGSVVSPKSISQNNLVPLTEDLAGVTILDQSKPMEMTKVIVNRNTGEVLATNSIQLELLGGKNRDAYFINMSTRALDDLSAPIKHK